MQRNTSQFGETNIYVERNDGNIFISRYVSNTKDAFENGSYELDTYVPSIQPPIERREVKDIYEWIERNADRDVPKRVSLLYGKAGIGKSVVMHEVLKKVQERQDYHVLGLKSDQIEFADTDNLSDKLHLAKPLEEVIRELAAISQRVVLLIDQIDALSLSLSSNRTPLRSLLKLIHNIQRVHNVRVVISCRPYDLEYDPILEQLDIKQKWELKEFSKDEVQKVLSEHNYDKTLSEEMQHFLGNPLYLHLFLKVYKFANLSFPLTEEVLYDKLWEKYICDLPEEKIDRNKLIECLDAMVNRMYNQQELTVHIALFESKYVREINYLLGSEILKRTPNGLVQFFHQTMFDYVYARRFIENGRNLLDELKGQHQGLFIRSSVKSIIMFLRSYNPKEYKKTIVHLLYDVDEQGNQLYRFHIRSLVLTTMAYFEKPIEVELRLIETRLLDDQQHLIVLMDAIHNTTWFKSIKAIFDKKGGWKTLDQTIKEKLVVIGRRVVWMDSDVILDFSTELLSNGGEEIRGYISSMLNVYDLKMDSDKLVDIYNGITTTFNPLQNHDILKSLIQSRPEYVMHVLTENIKLQLKEPKEKYVDRVRFNYYDEKLFEEIEKKHPELVVDFYLNLIDLILEDKTYLIDSHEIRMSIEFGHFKRIKDSRDYHDFLETLINKILDNVISDIENQADYHDNLLYTLALSELDVKVFMALYCYTVSPQHYRDQIFSLMISRKILANAPTWVEYQSGELLRVSFPVFTDVQKVEIINYILDIVDEGEKLLFDKELTKKHLEYGRPISWIGNRIGTLLNLLPQECLRDSHPKAYKKLLEMKRKFHPKALENNVPFKMESHSGWSSMKRDEAEKMSNEAWINSMRTYNTDEHFDWNRPSLTGQQHILEEQAKKEPEEKYNLIMEVIPQPDIPLSYPISGMKGLIEAGRIDLAAKVFDAIVNEIGEDINREFRKYDLHSFLFAIDGFIKQDDMPPSVIDFICQAVVEAQEDLSYREETSNDLYNRGINLPRGNAGYKLVECCKFEQYKEQIFETLESVAHNSSEFTRAAILLNFASLNYLDKDRSLELFLSFMYDYHPKLMSMPVHNYNPLVYYVNYGFDKLVTFFVKALEQEECYEQQVIVLWLAWIHTHKPKAKQFLDIMCERSEKARRSLIKFLCHLDDTNGEDTIEYLMYLMDDRFYSVDMASDCDDIFHNINKIEKRDQYRLADTFIHSKMCSGKMHCFYNFLASYALADPIQTLKWLKEVLEKSVPEDFNEWSIVTDVLIQSYNGIKIFDDEDYKPLLDESMNLLDRLMQRPENRYIINNFINKLDNE